MHVFEDTLIQVKDYLSVHGGNFVLNTIDFALLAVKRLAETTQLVL